MRTNAIVTTNTSFAITHPFAVMTILAMAYEFSVNTAYSKLRFYKLTTIHEILTIHALITILAIATITTLIILPHRLHFISTTKNIKQLSFTLLQCQSVAGVSNIPLLLIIRY